MYKFKTKPWEHQKTAFDFCINKSSCGIFMDMGTGKSKVAIDLIINRGHQKTLLVCPKRVLKVWPFQFNEHSDDINVVSLSSGSGKKRSEIMSNYNGPYPVVFVINYDMIWREPLKSIILKYKFDCVVLDEAHRIKSPGGKASRYCHRLGRLIPWKIALTGTPIPHSPLDAYGLYRFLDETIFGTNYQKFFDGYCVENKFNHKKEYINQDELSDKMYKIAFRVESRDVLDLPIPIEQTYEVELPYNTMKIYKELDKESVLRTRTGPMAINNPLAQMTRLHQLTSGILARIDGGTDVIDEAKKNMLYDILYDLPTNEPIVVFAVFNKDLDDIREVCNSQGRKYVEVSLREDGVDTWKNGEADVIGIQIQAGSEGEDYTRSRYAIYYSLGYSLGDYQQSRARIDRPGQKLQPMFIHLIAKDTVDEDIMQALKDNKNVVDYIVDIRRKRSEI